VESTTKFVMDLAGFVCDPEIPRESAEILLSLESDVACEDAMAIDATDSARRWVWADGAMVELPRALWRDPVWNSLHWRVIPVVYRSVRVQVQRTGLCDCHELLWSREDLDEDRGNVVCPLFVLEVTRG
jgi:hypothetical protein